MAYSCYGIGTKVECTYFWPGRIFSVSRPGGGLFGRPITRESLGRFLFGGVFSAGSFVLTAAFRWSDPTSNSSCRDLACPRTSGALAPTFQSHWNGNWDKQFVRR